jgi:hypothetical protein
MTELPENVTLDWLGRQFMAQRDDLRRRIETLEGRQT